MKRKIMAMVLAAGLGVTGVAMTAQAAENGCSHSWKYLDNSYTYYEEWSNFDHAIHTVQDKKCTKCGIYGKDDEIIFEGHTLIVAPTGCGHLWECAYCGYYE